MDATTSQTLAKFSGINNVDPATRLSPDIVAHEYVYPLQQGSNIDIDNTFQLASRGGYTSVKTGTDIHSLWSHEDICLYADGVALLKLGTGYGTISLRTGLVLDARISYVPANDRIYYTNYYQIGFVKNDVDNGLPVPGREFKEPLPPGQFIEFFMGCLYVARDKILYISDPLCDYYDIRTGYRIFKDRITMLRHINEDGLYVADNAVWFIKGKANEDFDRQNVFPEKTIPYTDITVAGRYIDENLDGDIIMWTSEKGICMGDGKGNVTNITQSRYVFDARGRGTGFVREKENVRHYINSLY